MILSLVAVILVSALTALLMRRLGTDEAIRDAKEQAALAGRSAVAPLLTPALEDGDPAAIARLDAAMRTLVLDNDIVRVKVWDAGGRILYADEKRLIGTTFALEDDEREALDGGQVVGNLSELDRDENTFERDMGKLLQVYVPLRTERGNPVLFETYRRSRNILTNGTSIFLVFLPAALGAVLLLWLTQGPLAYGMARRLRTAHAQREALLAAAVESAELERRRVASDLHDGTIQQIAGVAYALEAGADRAPRTGTDDLAEVMREGAEDLRMGIRQLRNLVVQISPPDLRAQGLASALSDLVTPLTTRGITPTLDLEQNVSTSAETEALLFRAAQEGVRNVVQHAGASEVAVSLRREGDRVALAVTDDGRGCADDARARSREEGHVGLSLLEALVRERGGTLELAPANGRGTRLTVRVPA